MGTWGMGTCSKQTLCKDKCMCTSVWKTYRCVNSREKCKSNNNKNKNNRNNNRKECVQGCPYFCTHLHGHIWTLEPGTLNPEEFVDSSPQSGGTNKAVFLVFLWHDLWFTVTTLSWSGYPLLWRRIPFKHIKNGQMCWGLWGYTYSCCQMVLNPEASGVLWLFLVQKTLKALESLKW